MAKKAFYIFLSSLLGVLIFLILHRAIIFIYLYLVSGGYFADSFNYWNFLFWDYITLIFSLMLGAWYGIWLGMSWHEAVYVQKNHGGFVEHLASHYWLGGRPKNLETKIITVKQRLDKDLSQLEDLAKADTAVEVVKPQAKVRRVVRKRAPKKLNSLT
jgi:hypothetical protein